MSNLGSREWVAFISITMLWWIILKMLLWGRSCRRWLYCTINRTGKGSGLLCVIWKGAVPLKEQATFSTLATTCRNSSSTRTSRVCSNITQHWSNRLLSISNMPRSYVKAAELQKIWVRLWSTYRTKAMLTVQYVWPKLKTTLFLWNVCTIFTLNVSESGARIPIIVLRAEQPFCMVLRHTIPLKSSWKE